MSTVTLADGKQYTVRYRMRAIELLNTEVGVNLLTLVQDDGANDRLASLLTDPAKISGLLWAGLVSAHPELTREWVADQMELKDLSDYAQAITDALASGVTQHSGNPTTVSPTSATSGYGTSAIVPIERG